MSILHEVKIEHAIDFVDNIIDNENIDKNILLEIRALLIDAWKVSENIDFKKEKEATKLLEKSYKLLDKAGNLIINDKKDYRILINKIKYAKEANLQTKNGY